MFVIFNTDPPDYNEVELYDLAVFENFEKLGQCQGQRIWYSWKGLLTKKFT